MSLGEKIREQRKKVGLSQEQLADKLCVSRQAVTKWETDRGLPDIDNIQALSKLFGISIDALLDDSEELSSAVLKEAIDISRYHKGGTCRKKYDAVVKEKFANAESIYALSRLKKLSTVENVFDFIVGAGVLQAADALNDPSPWYLVELNHKQYLVNVTKEFIESRELLCRFTEKKQVIGHNTFRKLYRI